jgi:hypothetical protein
MLLLEFGAIDFEQRGGAAEQHFRQRLDGMSFPAPGWSEQEHGTHGAARLPGLHFNALKKPENGISGLGLADNPGAPTASNVFKPGTARGGPQSDPSFGFVLDANAGLHSAPFISSDLRRRSMCRTALCSPLSSAEAGANMRAKGAMMIPNSEFTIPEHDSRFQLPLDTVWFLQ